jgi:hypothetical protein
VQHTDRTEIVRTKVFISYSWDSEDHKAWIRKLADDLEEIEELHVVWDGYDLDSMSDKNLFMESGIVESDYIVVIATSQYKAKADARSGGVGIETFLAAAAHWNDLLQTKRTKIILGIRQPNSTPRYLAGHFHIDFSEDAKYQASVQKLIAHLQGSSRMPRPAKQKSLATDEAAGSFTRAEDLIRIGYTNRRPIVNAAQGTDFSGANRIKYELWETRSPTVGYFLALANNINISQTIQHAIEKLREHKLHPVDLTVLKPRPGRAERSPIVTLLEQAGFTSKVHEYTYKDYIWEFCIDNTLKGMDVPTQVANYTDQSLCTSPSDTANEPAPSALEFLIDLLQKTPSSKAARLIVAPGGMGKTSLCLSVAAKLHNRNDLNSSVVLIQAEAVKRYVADQGLLAFARIDSIYHLYELYSRVQNHDQMFDRATFDMAVLCGNLIVIIDGLDEFTSLFQDRFNLDSFLVSLKTLHEQLGSSNILLTTRNNSLIEDARLEELTISKYELLGFDSKSCEKYINRRFKGYGDASRLAKKVLAQIEKVRLHDQEGRVVPFFADIAATVAEDELHDQHGTAFEVRDDPTPYPSNNELTDHIIHSVLRREETRHGLDISVPEIVHLFSALVVDFGKRWPAAEMRERLMLLYDARGKNLYAKIALNPLLVQTREDMELRYGFLGSHFEVLYVLEGALNQSIEKGFIRCLGRMSPEGAEFRELRRYFSNKQDILHTSLKALIPQLCSSALTSEPERACERETARRAIAALLSLYASVASGSMQLLTEKILNVYGVSMKPKASATIEGLFIRGDFPPLDFTDLNVVSSKFQYYPRLLASKFLRTKFIFTSFDGCGNVDIKTTTLTESMIDPSCELGDLRDSLSLFRTGKYEAAKIVEAEAKKFLHCFFKGDRFTDNNRLHVKFSNKVPGLSDNRFDRLIGSGYLSIKSKKEVDTFYEISASFRPSVRRLLTDNYPDAQMKGFFSFIRRTPGSDNPGQA